VSAREILVVYDKECPVCDAYCHAVRIPESVGELRLVNAPEDMAVMEESPDGGLASSSAEPYCWQGMAPRGT